MIVRGYNHHETRSIILSEVLEGSISKVQVLLCFNDLSEFAILYVNRDVPFHSFLAVS